MENKITFIAKYPVGKKQQDGASVRILEIDNIFSQHDRVYIESFSFPIKTLIYTILKNLKHKLFFEPLYKNEKISSYRFINKKRTKELFERAKIIYVESYGNLIMLPPEIIKTYGHKMVFDFHGCAVEEAMFSNIEKWKIDNLKYYEELAMHYIKNFVVVSMEMKNFYIQKYPSVQKSNFIYLPIFPNNGITINNNKDTDKLSIIYSGRNYIWQNSELMMQTIAKMVNSGKINNVEYTFLTPDVEYYTNLSKKYSVENYVKCRSISPDKLNEEYAKAHFGFILRDNNFVNKVSCPTKLVEYMKSGIIPIVLQPEIGDFNKLGYKYILNEDLINGNIPTLEEQEVMRKINYNIIEKLNEQVKTSKQDLLDMVSI